MKWYGFKGFPSHSSHCSGGLFPQYSGVSPHTPCIVSPSKSHDTFCPPTPPPSLPLPTMYVACRSWAETPMVRRGSTRLEPAAHVYFHACAMVPIQFGCTSRGSCDKTFLREGFLKFFSVGFGKGVFWKRCLFRKVRFRENLEILAILKNPRPWRRKENPTIF